MECVNGNVAAEKLLTYCVKEPNNNNVEQPDNIINMSSSKFANAGMFVEELRTNGNNPQSKGLISLSSADCCDDGKPLAQRGNVVNPYTLEILNESAQYIKDRIDIVPEIAIICGSGLGSLATILDEKVEIPYGEIPHFPRSTVPGHAGKLVVGKMGKVPVVCMQGRFHFYEGYPLWKCAMPVRVFKLLQVKMMIVTNAAGGLNSNYKVGDIMLIKDHINFPGFAGDNFLRGPNDTNFGERFVAMNSAYNRELRELGMSVAKGLQMEDFFHEGVYTMVGGPTFETVAELKLMKICGVDAVGMSTVPEVIAAQHCGIKCFGFSLITNKAVIDYDTTDEPNHEEVQEEAKKREGDLNKFVAAFVEAVNRTGIPK